MCKDLVVELSKLFVGDSYSTYCQWYNKLIVFSSVKHKTVLHDKGYSAV